MPELRWNPLLETYTMVAANRQARPNMPKDWCPFCPGPDNTKVPAAYTVLAYPNDFPTLSQQPESVVASKHSFFTSAPAYGKCEVILYSSDHHATLPQLPLAQIVELVELWKNRTQSMYQDPKISYVFVFENRGAEVGVTMPHPHGQIYAYGWLPLKLKVELDACKRYFQEKKSNLIQDLVKYEMEDGRRILIENESFVCFLPYFTDYPYGIFIVAKAPKLYFTDFDTTESQHLADILQQSVGMLDALFGKTFPYMMCVHQGAQPSSALGDQREYFQFHIEFYPPLRSENAIKWYASSEMGAWAAANTRDVNDTAQELRHALKTYESTLS